MDRVPGARGPSRGEMGGGQHPGPPPCLQVNEVTCAGEDQKILGW